MKRMVLTCVSKANSVLNTDKVGNFSLFLDQQRNSGIDQGCTVLEKNLYVQENTDDPFVK